MNELYELLEVLREELEYEEEDLDLFRLRLRGKELEIFERIRERINLTDEDIFEELEFNYPSDPNYRRYKRELKTKFTQEILHYTPTYVKFYPHYANYFLCNQLYACVISLKGMSKLTIANSLSEKLLRKAKQYHFTNIIADVSLMLAKYYRTKVPDQEKAEAYEKDCLEATRLLQYERDAELKYSRILSQYIDTKNNKPLVSKLANEYVSELTWIAQQKLPSPKFYLFFYLLKTLVAEGVGDFEQSLIYSKEGLTFFEELGYDHRQGKRVFVWNVSNCLLQLGHYSAAKKYLEKSLKLVIEGRENWFMALRLQMQIFIHEQNYSDACRCLSEMLNESTFSDLPSYKKDLYNLFQAYLDFLAMVGMVPAVPVPTRFKINKFINEVPEFDRDNRGMKIPLIIAQLLYFIYDRNYDAMEQRLDALKQYCSIHLRRESPNFRSNCFIKMLLTIPVNDFNPVAVRRKAEKFVKRLEYVPFAISQQPAEIEIVPYEHLWEIVLTYLSAPKRKRKNPMDKELFRIKGVE